MAPRGTVDTTFNADISRLGHKLCDEIMYYMFYGDFIVVQRGHLWLGHPADST